MDVTYFPRYRNTALYSRPDFLGVLLPKPTGFDAGTWGKTWEQMSDTEKAEATAYYNRADIKAAAASAGASIWDVIKSKIIPAPAAAPGAITPVYVETEKKFFGLTSKQLAIAGGGLALLLIILTVKKRRA